MAQATAARGFRAMHDFWCDELDCQYVEGMTYTVRVGNDALAGRVAVWVADGMAEWTHDEDAVASDAVAAGVGEVN